MRYNSLLPFLRRRHPARSGGDTVADVYGGMFVHSGSAPQANITTSESKLTGFTGAFHSDGITVDHANDILIPLAGGDFFAMGQFSFSGDNNVTFEFDFAIDDVSIVGGGCRRKLGAGGDVGSASFFAILEELSVNAEVSIRVKSDQGGGASLTLVDAQLLLFRVHE